MKKSGAPFRAAGLNPEPLSEMVTVANALPCSSWTRTGWQLRMTANRLRHFAWRPDMGRERPENPRHLPGGADEASVDFAQPASLEQA